MVLDVYLADHLVGKLRETKMHEYELEILDHSQIISLTLKTLSLLIFAVPSLKTFSLKTNEKPKSARHWMFTKRMISIFFPRLDGKQLAQYLLFMKVQSQIY